MSTTTDSNLLDGEWSFAFATHSASSILDTSRFLLSHPKRVEKSEYEGKNTVTVRGGGPWNFRAGKIENPFRSSTRQICLENLSGVENAHIVDETRVLGRMFRTSRRYDVFGLTRTALDLDLTESESKLFGFFSNSKTRDDFKGTKLGNPVEIQILYLDTDLCICTTEAGLDGPLHVYTKSDLWLTGGARRKVSSDILGTVNDILQTGDSYTYVPTLHTHTQLRGFGSWILTLQSPLRIRQRLINVFTSTKNSNRPTKAPPGVKAVNIGELDIDEFGKTTEDKSWDGPDDPFAHLSPGERMEMMRTMSLQDIYQAAYERKELNKKRQKKQKKRKGGWSQSFSE